MSPVRAPKIAISNGFRADVKGLRQRYPEVDAAVNEFKETLLAMWRPAHIPVDEKAFPGIYSARVDYPALGSVGRHQFLATYHAKVGKNPMQEPLVLYTLVTLTERQR